MVDSLHPRELEFRRARIAHLRASWTPEFAAEQRRKRAGWREQPAEALRALAELRRTGDVPQFRDALKVWALLPGTLAFNGPNGQMFINQLTSLSGDDAAFGPLLADCLSIPHDDDHAAEKLTSLLEHVAQIRRGAYPAPARVPFVLSYFWAMQDHERWPVYWRSALDALDALGWWEAPADHAQAYLSFSHLVLALGRPDDIEDDLLFLDEQGFVGLDPGLVERCRWAKELVASDEDVDTIDGNLRAILGELRIAGRSLHDQVSTAVGRDLRVLTRKLQPDSVKDYGWVDWRVPGTRQRAAIRLQVSVHGVGIGLSPGWYHAGWHNEARALIGPVVPGDLRFYADWGSKGGGPLEERAEGDTFIARWYPGDSALARADLAQDIIRTAADLQPALDRIVAETEGPKAPRPPPTDDWLAGEVERFEQAQSYPTEKDKTAVADREDLAALLDPAQLALRDVAAMRRIYTTGRYGGPGPQSILSSTLHDPDATERFFRAIEHLLWSDAEPVERRVDRVLDETDLGVRGFKDSVVMKLLAIVDPIRWIPVFPLLGPKGKLAMLQALELPLPPNELSTGQRHAQANDALRERLQPYFGDDRWGMMRFLYWLLEREHEPPVDESDVIAELAEELLIDAAQLRELEQLLREKKQVVFYGPPGTGKTYVARKLAKAITTDPTRRSLVQFHPSTTYEDFFEGYRPEPGPNGQLTYRLTPGPLALLAERAAEAPLQTHVMVIDEINRANLPKVLGELLFLLEYRDETVQTLYRGEEGFSLPPNLLVIGTMNTADRSIALIDAALRRRFHFVKFFPEEGLIDDLLETWLDKHGEPTWVGELVALVNSYLSDDLGGPHLQLGPSHFMRRGLDEAAMRRIWEYDVIPFIEDQFFGEPTQIDRYRFDRVMDDLAAQRGEAITDTAAGAGASVDGTGE